MRRTCNKTNTKNLPHNWTKHKPQNSGLVAFYDTRPGNGAGLFYSRGALAGTAQQPVKRTNMKEKNSFRQ